MFDERPADPDQPEGGFGEGEADPEKFDDEDHVGRFSEGQEELGEDDPEKHHLGRFGEGQEEDENAEQVEGSFGTGQEEDA
jgi:hypothetical protein